MPKKRQHRSEKYIHIEERNGAYRAKVTVSHHKDSATFSTWDESMRWARQRRQVFLDSHDANQGAPASAPLAVPAQVWPICGYPFTYHAPPPVKLMDVFDSYETNDIPWLTGAASERSRLKNLRRWFGDRTVDELDEKFIVHWKEDRLKGKFGSGRDPQRAATMSPEKGALPLTKHERYRKKRAGKDVPVLPVHAVTTQSVRHELSLLRRTVRKYFDRENRGDVYGHWWQAHYLNRMQLPAPSDPRSRRVSDDELKQIFNSIESRSLKAAIMFAVLTSLRRGEIVSLLWEDVDLERRVVRLRKPSHNNKTKVNAREVVLLPSAVIVLRELGVKKRGPIFDIPLSSFSNEWRNAADKAEAFDARLHDCRREAITRLVEKFELTLVEVAAGFSGHSDIKTLQKHYLRLDSGRLAAKLAERPGASDIALRL